MTPSPLRKRLGESVRFAVQCRSDVTTLASPDAAPQLSIYAADGTEVVSDQRMVPFLFPTLTGMFFLEVFLSSSFSAGWYAAHIGYAVSTVAGGDVQHFEVTAGGNNLGANQAVYFYPRPDSDWVVAFRDGLGTFEYRQNPREAT
jgi:hypothetical protein